MKQCLTCRYTFDKGGELCCRNGERYVQLCRLKNGVGVLSAVPGRCEVINRDDDCTVYRRKGLLSLRGLLMAFRGRNDNCR